MRGGLFARAKISTRGPVFIDCEIFRSYIALAQSRTCLWVSADPRMVREIGKVTGANPSGRFSGQPPNRGHLEATTVRAFLVLFRLSKDRGYSKRHTIIAGSADGSPIQAKADKASIGRKASAHRRVTTRSWFRGLHRLVPWVACPAFVHRATSR